MYIQKDSKSIIYTTITLLLLLSLSLSAMPPHPDLVEKIESGEIEEPFALTHRNELLKIGVDQPSQSVFRSGGFKNPAEPGSSSFNMLCVLINFTDRPFNVSGDYFDSLLFAQTLSSVRVYYDEISYGTFDLLTIDMPSAVGWQTAPQTYGYYCNSANGLGNYPQNCQKLCEDIVDLIDPIVNFANYDNNGDGYVDGLTLVHTGPGAELTGLATDIWSHKWNVTSPRSKDGKLIWVYSIQPEYWFNPGDMTIGVFAHEFGHAIFGLPDLYDTDGSSHGIGKWSLMAGGSWNGSLGASPAHLDAWCRIDAGFVTPTNIAVNTLSQSIPNIEQNATCFRLWTSGGASNEYYLVENRQKIGYDAALPGDGILIWHIDDNVATDNKKEWYPGYTTFGHYMVALEQADNSFHLEQTTNHGDAADPFPGSTINRNFNAVSSPSSNDYSGSGTLVGVTNISNSGTTMTADLLVSLLASVEDYEYDNSVLPDQFELDQNFPNPFNPRTRISFELPRSSNVTLVVYNILGQEIDILIDGELPQGRHEFDWIAEDDNGNELPSGIYFYRILTDEFNTTRKMVLLQ